VSEVRLGFCAQAAVETRISPNEIRTSLEPSIPDLRLIITRCASQVSRYSPECGLPHACSSAIRAKQKSGFRLVSRLVVDRRTAFRDNLEYILKYSRKLNLASVTPHNSLSSTGYCLAQTPKVGAEYLVYAPSGGSFTVNLSAMSASRTLSVEWFNPSTGAAITGDPIPAGSSSQSFSPPFSGDAVLYMVDKAGRAAPGRH